MGENKGLLKFLKLEGIVNNFTHLIESKIELAKVETKEEIALFLSKMAVFVLLFTIGLFFILFISFALAYLIGNLLNDVFLGFIVISGVYLFLFLSIYFFRDKIKLHERCHDLLRKTLHTK